MSTESIYKQHEENENWLENLSFYEQELGILQKRLAEIVDKNTDEKILAESEHFQNQFIVQKDNIDEIKHAVKQNENFLEDNIEENPVAVDHRKVEYHTKEKDLVETFEKNYAELKSEFEEFVAKWL